jgi:very-short-patch-repair endonuclease
VLERLIGAGYRAEAQVWIGRYRIDIVVSGNGEQVAVECDGDRFHGVDQIPADMERQAVLERAGWRFVRIRGTRFYRDPDATTAWVLGELARLGVGPSETAADALHLAEQATAFRDRVVRRAWEVMREQGWVGEARTTGSPAHDAGDQDKPLRHG